MSNSKTLNWNDRFALLDHFAPSDTKACSIFGVSQTELETARSMKQAGAFRSSSDMDVESYSKMFSASKKTDAKAKTGSTSTTKSRKPGYVAISISDTKPESATKSQKVLKKRGRKGDKISKAFSNIPQTPTPVSKFVNDNEISLAVLRQSKRFDTNPELGAVHVKKDKTLDTLMIWRDAT